jgi:hypothetical protein
VLTIALNNHNSHNIKLNQVYVNEWTDKENVQNICHGILFGHKKWNLILDIKVNGTKHTAGRKILAQKDK